LPLKLKIKNLWENLFVTFITVAFFAHWICNS